MSAYLAGIHAGLWTLGLLTSVVIAIAALGLAFWAIDAIDIPHRWRVRKLRRDMRRTGRTIRGNGCTCPDPALAAHNGHLLRCPMATATPARIRVN